MVWSFTLIQMDSLNNITETVIDEPAGWNGLSSPLVRDEWHGMGITLSTGNLQFINDGYWIIKEEYILKGINGNIGIRIDWRCDECDGWKVYFPGKLDFRRYKEFCGNDCYITIGIEDNSLLSLLKDRQDTDVDLTSLIAYDGVTALNDYLAMGQDILIPSKALQVISEGRQSSNNVSENFVGTFEWEDATKSAVENVNSAIFFGFNNVLLSEVADTTFYDKSQTNLGGLHNPIQSGAIPFIDMQAKSALKCASLDGVLSFRIKGSVEQQGDSDINTYGQLNVAILPKGADINVAGSLQTKYQKVLWLYPAMSGNATASFDDENELQLPLSDGDQLFFFIYLTKNNLNHFSSFIITLNVESYLKYYTASICDPSPAKIFLIHEAASRIVESISNNQLKFKSAYYGRTDSQPYPFLTDGCNSLLGITNGLLLRRAVLTDGTQPKAFTSFKKLKDSADALDCIGVGIEYDEALQPVVAMEPIRHFYSDEIIFTADGVNELTRSIKTDRIWKQFKFGFDKFETESTNGLDAIHTQRQYRLPLINTDQTLEKICSYIFDGYATEVTRRKFGTSEDWRYDQNIFGLCLTRNSSQPYSVFTANTSITFLSNISIDVPVIIVSMDVQAGDTFTYNGIDYFIVAASFNGDFLQLSVSPSFPANGTFANQLITLTRGSASGINVEQGNITGGENLFDPATVINYRVSPVRNAMKWFKWLMQGVTHLAVGDLNEAAQMLFNSGVGNYVAKGELTSNVCNLEKDVIAENEALRLDKYFDPENGTPFIMPEDVEFTFPLGLNEFLHIKENMYGLIKYRQLETEQFSYAWIDKIEPNHEDGDAKFILTTAKVIGSITSVLHPDCPGVRATIVSIVTDGDIGVIITGSAYAGTTNDIYGSVTGATGTFTLLSTNNSDTDLASGVTIDDIGSNLYFMIHSYNATDHCDYGNSIITRYYCAPAPTIDFTDNENGTITINVDNVDVGAIIKVYGSTTENGSYVQLGSDITAVSGINQIIVDATVYSWFKVGVTDDVCDHGFSNIINFEYDPCAGGIAPVINSITEDGTDIIIMGNAVPTSAIIVFASTSINGTYVPIGNDDYTGSDLIAGITLTALQYGQNVYFKVYSSDENCIYGYSSSILEDNGNDGGDDDDGIPPGDENPVFFIPTDEIKEIIWTVARIAKYGKKPVFQVWVYNEFTGVPEITTVSLDADIKYPDTTVFTYHNAGAAGYIVIIGNIDANDISTVVVEPGETAFGVIIGSSDSIDTKITVAQAMGVGCIRGAPESVSNYFPGKGSNFYNKCKARGMMYIMNINWPASLSSTAHFATNETVYKDNLEQILTDYAGDTSVIPVVVIENEPTVDNFYDGNISQYLIELGWAIEVCHAHTPYVKVADGALHIPLLLGVKHGNTSGNFGQVDQILTGINNLRLAGKVLDYVNMHTNATGIGAGDFAEAAQYFRDRTGIADVISNEWHLETTNNLVAADMVTQSREANLVYSIAYGGKYPWDGNNAYPFNDGAVLTSVGIAIKDKIANP